MRPVKRNRRVRPTYIPTPADLRHDRLRLIVDVALNTVLGIAYFGIITLLLLIEGGVL